MKFYEVDVPQHLMPGLILSVERDELGISAGLQDRVIQTYQGIVYMDFEKSLIEAAATASTRS
jgi:glucuronokinase